MKTKGFTLIELLIVVAIIAILAAIAVPNFLEAQTRSKVSRVKADLRSVATAMEAYYVDNNVYPPNDAGGVPQSQYRMNRVVMITTPIAYMTSLPSDPFLPGDRVVAGAALDGFQYFCYDHRYDQTIGPVTISGQPLIIRSWGHLAAQSNAAAFDIKGGCMKSWGPAAGKTAFPDDGNDGAEWTAYGLDVIAVTGDPRQLRGIDRLYDPTNGTISSGDLPRYIGAVQLPQVPN